MKKCINVNIVLLLLIFSMLNGCKSNSGVDGFKYNGSFFPDKNAVKTNFQFNGYTNYWHDISTDWIRYGNLFKMTVPNVDYTIAQSKIDIANDLKIPGLSLQEGLLKNLFSAPYVVLDQPTIQKLGESAGESNVLVLTEPDSEAGKILTGKLPNDNGWKEKLKSHQFNAVDFTEVNVFYLEKGEKRIYVISSKSKDQRDKVLDLITKTKDLLEKYDLSRGWFGAETLLKSVTITPGHPLEVIGKGMNEGNSWFVFSGYMDFLAQKELIDWLAKVKLPVVADVGFGQAGQIYGCNDYDGLQVQSMFTPDAWIKYAHSKGGYVFRQVYDTVADNYKYDGYVTGVGQREENTSAGNKEQIDMENIPFVTTTGTLEGGAVPCMVLFIKKGEQITKQLMYDAIMNRREVSVLDNGKMMGSDLYRNALGLLLLDRIYLEEYFGDRISLESSTKGYQLNVSVTNTYPHAVSGTLEIVLPAELKIAGQMSTKVDLQANSSKTIEFTIQPQADAMNKTNPIAVHYKWDTGKKSTLTILDLPRAISVQQLLYGHSPKVTYPVTVHNFTDESTFPVKVEVLDKNDPSKIIYTNSASCSAAKGTFQNLSFDLEVPPGGYNVKVTALGIENISQLGVGEGKGVCKVTEVDLNNDGINEYVMENENLKATVLAIGGRVIEYYVKSRNDNVLFKLWPEKPIDDRRSNRKVEFYPYGGFEDFLGQGSMETHKLYHAEILKKEGDYVSVKLTADYYGNKLEKIYTLYGNSNLLEAQFALTFKDPYANVLGPQPILELGKKHWTEDIYIVPEKDGLNEYVMKPEKYYGRIFYPTEGWYAGWDSKENITFIGAYPVNEPLFLHMWFNHPVNPGSHYYYVEFQPWVPIYQKSTMYFTYYLYAAGENWQNGVKTLREMNLITKSNKK
jgi:hypothetical protein